MNPEAPDADVQEQRQEVVPEPVEPSGAAPLEANEADAYEQHQEVPLDEEDGV